MAPREKPHGLNWTRRDGRLILRRDGRKILSLSMYGYSGQAFVRVRNLAFNFRVPCRKVAEKMPGSTDSPRYRAEIETARQQAIEKVRQHLLAERAKIDAILAQISGEVSHSPTAAPVPTPPATRYDLIG